MDITPFIQFTLETRFIARWMGGAIIIFIPVLNFLSLGFLSRTSRLLTIEGVGLPTWGDKYETWIEGVKVLFIFILYGAIPFFLFSCGYFLTTLSSVTAIFGTVMMKVSYVALLFFCFFLPFAFVTFADREDFGKALEYEKIYLAIKEVFLRYLVGYVATLVALYVCKILITIPYLIGFILSSVLCYYVLLIATYYFTRLYGKTTLGSPRFHREPDTQE